MMLTSEKAYSSATEVVISNKPICQAKARVC